MLTDAQLAHYNTFGFLHLSATFSASEMTEITRAAEELWERDSEPSDNEERRSTYFIERCPRLAQLATDDRIYPVIEKLLGPDFIWVGSEGNISHRDRVNWHPDRKYYREGEEHWIDYRQVKLMMYFEKVLRDTGCLRVIPGSHRMPYHKALASQEIDPSSEPFGLDGSDIPCAALESEPGDVILFDHCIWHGAFGGGSRRYIAMKFAATPTVEDQLTSLQRYTPMIFEPHDAFVNHDDARIRRLVENLSRYAQGL